MFDQFFEILNPVLLRARWLGEETLLEKDGSQPLVPLVRRVEHQFDVLHLFAGRRPALLLSLRRRSGRRSRVVLLFAVIRLALLGLLRILMPVLRRQVELEHVGLLAVAQLDGYVN